MTGKVVFVVGAAAVLAVQVFGCGAERHAGSKRTQRAQTKETCIYVNKGTCGPNDSCNYRCVDPARSDDTCQPCVCGCPGKAR